MKRKKLLSVLAALVVTLGVGFSTPTYAGDNNIPTRINAHVGEDASTSVNISWMTDVLTDAKIRIAQGNGRHYVTYTGTSREVIQYEDTSYKKPVTKVANQVEIKGLKPNKRYNYIIGEGKNAVMGSFETAPKTGKAPVKFVYVADPQVKTAENGEAWAATAHEISKIKDLDFLYIAGDHTDKTAVDSQWTNFFNNNGLYPNAVQDLLRNTSLVSVYGNHDTKDDSLQNVINLPDEYSKGVYSFDYGTVRFISLNLETAKSDLNEREHQYEVTKKLVEEAKKRDMWTIVAFHKSIYTGASHIDDGDVIEARKFWAPRLADMGVNAVLQGHDHVYSRGFIDANGMKADVKVNGNGEYILPENAPLYMVGNHSGGLKWYSKVDYEVTPGDPLMPDYKFLDKNSIDDGSDVKRQQTWTEIEATNTTLTFKAYMMKYNEETDTVDVEPYLYDSFTIRRK